MSSASRDGDLTARATIRNAALRLFAERGPDAVTMREIAAEAGVSAALVVHHFGSKDGLRAAVDAFAAQAFEGVFAELDERQIAEVLAGGKSGSIAEAFARSFPAGSPLPAYLRRLLLTGDPAGDALFARWYRVARQLLDSMVAIGAAKASGDVAVRAAFLLVNDLALVLLREQVALVIDVDPLSREGIARWAEEVTTVYVEGAFIPPPTESQP